MSKISNWKTIVAMVLSLLLLFSLVTTTAYAAKEDDASNVKTVRLGYFSFQNYMLGASEDDEKSGYAYDLLCDVAAINGWKYEFVYGDFNDLYKMFLNDEIDILPCLVYTPERAKVHLFSDEEIYEEQYFISTTNENVNGPIGLIDLNGKKISSVVDCYQNVVFEEWAKENGVNMEMVLTPSFDESWQLVKDGEADFVLNIDSAAQNSGYTTLFEVGRGSSRFAVAPSRQDILDELNSAIDTIYEINPFAMNHLKEKYLSGTLSSYKLSDEEKKWLGDRDVIRVAGFTDDMPYTYENKDGKVTGVYPDALLNIFEKLGIDTKVEWILYHSLQDMRDALFAGEVDLICPDYCRQYYTQTSDVIISEELQAVNMALLYSERMTENRIKRIATPESRLGIYYVREYYPDAEIIKCQTVDECIKAVASGKADAALAHTTVLQEKSAKYSQSFTIKTLVAGCPVCFSTIRENGPLVCIINRGLHLITDNELQTLESEHSPNKDYTAWNYIRDHKFLVSIIVIAFVMIVLYAIERNFYTRNLKKNLDEIIRQKEIIEKSEKELLVAKEAANIASKAKSTFLFNMSHDIRTPMNAILGYSDRMLRHIDDKKVVSDSAGKIKSSGEYLLSLINDVLDMARIESDKVEMEETINDIKQKGHSLCDIFEVDMQKKDLTFNVDLDDIDDSILWYDSLKIKQIMLNLISNAIKYTPVGGTVFHSMRQIESDKPGYAKLEFITSDNGIGMSEEFVAHIFDQFSRSDDSITKETQGTGLGMSIVGKLVDLMGGTIDIQSEVGKGTTITIIFTFRIPTEEEIAQYKAEQEISLNKANIKDIRVFLVDDNELNREIAQDILEEEGCIVVDIAENGEVAVEKVALSSPSDFDIILMDVQMPVMDGYEATRRIRALDNPELANKPIIAMTANAFEEDRQNAMEAGMNAHIAKPIDIQKLVSTLSEYIKQ